MGVRYNRTSAGNAHKTNLNRAVTAEEQVRAYDLKLEGKTYRQIGAEMGFSYYKARSLVEKEIGERVHPKQDEYVQMELDRLDVAQQKVAEVMAKASGELMLKAVDRLVRLSERRSHLLGLDAARKIDATVHEVNAQDVELIELINTAKAKAAAALQQIQAGGPGGA